MDGITTRTEGEVDDRHVVVYKLGYEPPDEEVMLDPQVGTYGIFGVGEVWTGGVDGVFIFCMPLLLDH